MVLLLELIASIMHDMEVKGRGHMNARCSGAHSSSPSITPPILDSEPSGPLPLKKKTTAINHNYGLSLGLGRGSGRKGGMDHTRWCGIRTARQKKMKEKKIHSTSDPPSN